MSYRSRQKKRQLKIAVTKAKREHGDAMATRYYRTITKRPCQCSARGCRLRSGDDMVYRHNGKVTLCIACADADPLVDYRTSTKWEQRRERQRKKARWKAAARRAQADRASGSEPLEWRAARGQGGGSNHGDSP